MAGGVLAILGVIHKVRHARWVGDRVSVTKHYMAGGCLGDLRGHP